MTIDTVELNKIDMLIAEWLFGWTWVQHAPAQEAAPGYGPLRYRFLADPSWIETLGDDPSWVIVHADMTRAVQYVPNGMPRYTRDPRATFAAVDEMHRRMPTDRFVKRYLLILTYVDENEWMATFDCYKTNGCYGETMSIAVSLAIVGALGVYP